MDTARTSERLKEKPAVLRGSARNPDAQRARDLLAGILGVRSAEVGAPDILGDGISNASWLCRVGAEAYVLRVTSEPQLQKDKLTAEGRVYEQLRRAGASFADELVHFDADRGLKVTRYIGDVRYPDLSDEADIARCAALLRRVHESGIRTDESFDLSERFIESERAARAKADPSRHMEGYTRFRNEALAIYAGGGDAFRHRFCHIDPIRFNFLLGPGGDRLIDFEYSAMASPMIDIAAFVVYHKLRADLIEVLLRAYLGRAPEPRERASLARYLPLEGLYSALWYLERLEEGTEMKMYMDESYASARAYAREAGHAY
jgi:thiamine kinase-like enzyme